MNKHEQLKAKLAEFRALADKSEWTAEDQAASDKLKAEIEALRADIERDNERIEARRTANQHEQFLNGSNGNPDLEFNGRPNQGTEATEAAEVEKEIRTAVAQVRIGGLKNFRGEKAAERAFRAGKWMQATLGNNAEARKFCQKAGIEVRMQRESANADGGWLVPVEIENTIIDLREEYGVIRRLAEPIPMGSNKKDVLRREGGLIAYPVGEGVKVTPSKKKWGNISLIAHKWAVMSIWSEELDEDSIISQADDTIGEMAYAFALQEDACGFIGDGTSIYHGTVGIIPKLKNLSATQANIAGLVGASGNNWGAVTLIDHTNMLGRVPAYVFKFSPRWICSSQYYFTVMERLIDAAGGTARSDIISGKAMMMFKGFPVEFVQTMDTMDQGANSVPLLFGAAQKAVMFGNRRGMTFATTTEATVDGENLFEQGGIAIRGTERFDINVYDVGNADPTAAKRVAGPLVGLQLR